MQVEFYNSTKICDLRDSWDKLNKNSNVTTPFQYFNWQSLLVREHNSNIIKRYFTKLYYAVLTNDSDEILSIAPIFIKKIGHKQGVFLIGTGGSSDYLDFIYDEGFSKEMFYFMIDRIMKFTRTKYFHFSLLHSDSFLRKYLYSSNNIISSYKNMCARLVLTRTYEDYWTNLSKSTRQNIRTAKNRINREGFESYLKIYDKEIMPSKVANELQALYEKRRRVKNDNQAGLKYKILSILRKKSMDEFNIYINSMQTCINSFAAIYYINGQVTSYCYGLKNNNGDIYIMQVAIDTDYGKLSPGMLLIDEVVKWIYENYADNLPIIDLTNGGESYKFTLGAHQHDTEFLILKKRSE